MDGASMDGASMDGALTDGGAATTGEGPTRDELTEGTYVELTLPGRRTLFAVRPPAAPNGHMLVVRKLGVEQLSLNELVRNGTISRGMATLLAHCVAGRANLLVVGPDGAGSGPLVHALVASLGVRSSGALWLSTPAIAGALPAESPVLDMGDTVASRVRAIEATARLAPPHVVAPPLGGPALIALLDAITHGLQGAIVRATAPTLRQAMNRMAMDVASTRGHLDPDTARQWLASAFDLGLEVARLRDDRVRVVRLAELHPPGAAGGSAPGDLRDIFSFAYHRTAAGGSVEGAFSASGTVPRVVEDLGARGMPLDTSIFRRHPSG